MKSESKSKEVYVNLKSDFGFKRIFGRPENKPLLISFLNALFQGDLIVEDVKYDNVEDIPELKEERGIRYDIYCHVPSQDVPGEASHHFIIEMQHQSQAHFDERALYYVANSLVKQAKRGEEYNFEFVPVIGIFIMDFRRDSNECKERVVERKWVSDIDTGEPFYDLLRMYFVKLPLIPKKADECVSERDMWIYCIKNLDKMNTIPFASKKPIFARLAEKARIANLSRQEYLEYERSLKAYRDERNIAAYNISIGEKKGMEKGIKKEKIETAKRMKAANIELSIIALSTGLSPEEIAKI